MTRNLRTVPPRASHPVSRFSPAPFRELFLAQYDSIRDICAQVDHAGVAIVAVSCSGGDVEAVQWLALHPNDINTAVIGRHTRCSVVLRDDPSVSLRHLALILHPSDTRSDNGSNGLRFHVVDLRTRLAFRDETGKRVEALVSEGPVFVQCGRYVLFFLLTGPGAAWPESAEQAWQNLPERVYVDRRSHLQSEPQALRGWLPPVDSTLPRMRSATNGRGEISMVTLVEGPERPRQLLADATDELLGRLDLIVGDQLQRFEVGVRAAGVGVLLGCYSRCDSDCLSLLTNRHISRVHLLLLRLNEQLYALDMASTNGTFVDGRVDDALRVRQIALSQETRLSMAKRAAWLTWTPRSA